MDGQVVPPIRITEVAGAVYYCPRSSWIVRTLGIRLPPSAVMLRGSVLHAMYEVFERDMLMLVKRHGPISTPEIFTALREHLIERGFNEILPALERENELADVNDKVLMKTFIIELADECAHLYITTYNHVLYHSASASTGKSDLLVREARREFEYRGFRVTGKPDWLQYTGTSEGFIIDYKTGHPKNPDTYQQLQAGGYAWLLMKAIGFRTQAYIVFWQGYHKFQLLMPDMETFQKALDMYIDMALSDQPPEYSKVPACSWCAGPVREFCDCQRGVVRE